jgi:hypothetical protein
VSSWTYRKAGKRESGWLVILSWREKSANSVPFLLPLSHHIRQLVSHDDVARQRDPSPLFLNSSDKFWSFLRRFSEENQKLDGWINIFEELCVMSLVFRRFSLVSSPTNRRTHDDDWNLLSFLWTFEKRKRWTRRDHKWKDRHDIETETREFPLLCVSIESPSFEVYLESLVKSIILRLSFILLILFGLSHSHSSLLLVVYVSLCIWYLIGIRCEYTLTFWPSFLTVERTLKDNRRINSLREFSQSKSRRQGKSLRQVKWKSSASISSLSLVCVVENTSDISNSNFFLTGWRFKGKERLIDWQEKNKEVMKTFLFLDVSRFPLSVGGYRTFFLFSSFWSDLFSSVLWLVSQIRQKDIEVRERRKDYKGWIMRADVTFFLFVYIRITEALSPNGVTHLETWVQLFSVPSGVVIEKRENRPASHLLLSRHLHHRRRSYLIIITSF